MSSINNENDIENQLNINYKNDSDGIPGSNGWSIDQEVLYKILINYENLKVLNRPIKRLEMDDFRNRLNIGETNFMNQYDDCHFHRSYINNEDLILNAEKQIYKNI